jgi:hypothetical protein
MPTRQVSARWPERVRTLEKNLHNGPQWGLQRFMELLIDGTSRCDDYRRSTTADQICFNLHLQHVGSLKNSHEMMHSLFPNPPPCTVRRAWTSSRLFHDFLSEKT